MPIRVDDFFRPQIRMSNDELSGPSIFEAVDRFSVKEKKFLMYIEKFFVMPK